MKNKGFSFVELLVAVAILGIISLPIVSSFALAAKTDAKATHLSAMNDAADDVMLLLEETKHMYDPDDDKSQIEQIDSNITSFNALLVGIESALPTESEDPLVYTLLYNGYSVTISLKNVSVNYYRADITVHFSVSGDTLEVKRKGLLSYA